MKFPLYFYIKYFTRDFSYVFSYNALENEFEEAFAFGEYWQKPEELPIANKTLTVVVSINILSKTNLYVLL